MKRTIYFLLLNVAILSCNSSDKPEHYGVYLNGYEIELKKYRYDKGYEGTEYLSEFDIKSTDVVNKLIVFSSEPVKESTFELWSNVKRNKNGKLAGNGRPKLFKIKKIEEETYELTAPNMGYGVYSLYKPEENIGYFFRVTL